MLPKHRFGLLVNEPAVRTRKVERVLRYAYRLRYTNRCNVSLLTDATLADEGWAVASALQAYRRVPLVAREAIIAGRALSRVPSKEGWIGPADRVW